jgi:hypothetical protein
MSRDCRDFSQESWKLSVFLMSFLGKKTWGWLGKQVKLGWFFVDIACAVSSANTEETLNSILTVEVQCLHQTYVFFERATKSF